MPRLSPKWPVFAAILALLFGLPDARAQAPALFTVGADPACSFTSLAEAIEAAAANDDGDGADTIHVARNQAYTAQALTIGAQDLDIIGGFDDCSDTVPSDVTTISGLGGEARSVFTLTGGGVRTLRHLNIRDGDAPFDGQGGGISYRGAGALVISHSFIQNNRAGRGGGIAVTDDGLLELQEGTVIVRNQALRNDGGGIYLDRRTRLVMSEDGSAILDNEAAQSGGGICIAGGASVEIRAGGLGQLGTIQGNRARRGAGVAVLGFEEEEGGIVPKLKMTASTPDRPVSLIGNVASEKGGAIYASARIFTVEGSIAPEVTLAGFRVIGNEAPDGAAFYSASDSSLSGRTGPRWSISRGLARFNIAQQAVFSIEHSVSRFDFARTEVVQNQGVDVFRVFRSDDSTFVRYILADTVVAGNEISGNLLHFPEQSRVTIERSTLVSNGGGAPYLIRFADDRSDLKLVQTIIAPGPGQAGLDWPGGRPAPGATVDSRQNLVAEKATLPASDTTSVVAPPRFVDPVNGDFRLRAGSPGIDFGQALGAPLAGGDLEGLVRDRDLAVKANAHGPRDAGAYERQAIGNLVLNAGFDTDLRIWQPVDFPQFTTKSDLDSAGSSASGSIQIQIPGTTSPRPSRVTGSTQCIHLPGPGEYQLSGRAFSGSAFAVTHDLPVIVWRYRNISDETCGGDGSDVVQQGEMQFPTASGWKGPLNGPITITATDWTPNSTIEVRLDVVRNASDPLNSDLFSRFDDIVLTAADDAANVAPVARDDAIRAYPGVPQNRLVGGASSLLVNDFDADGDALLATLVTAPAHGSLDFAGDGTFSYTHANDGSTSDEFIYRVCDTKSACATARVAISIVGGVIFADSFE